MSCAAAAMMVSSTARRPSRRCRSHSNRQTVAAAARFRDSARPVIGTRTVASARRGDLLGQAPRLVAEHERDGIGQVELVQVGVAARRPSRAPASRAPGARRSAAAVSGPRTTGRWNSEPAEARTVFGLYTSTEDEREDDGVGPDGVGGSQDRPGVARVADLVQDAPRTGGVVGQVVEADVDERRDADEPLRRDRRGEPAHHLVAHLDERDAAGARALERRVRRLGVEQSATRPPGCASASPTRPARPRRGTRARARGTPAS